MPDSALATLSHQQSFADLPEKSRPKVLDSATDLAGQATEQVDEVKRMFCVRSGITSHICQPGRSFGIKGTPHKLNGQSQQAVGAATSWRGCLASRRDATARYDMTRAAIAETG